MDYITWFREQAANPKAPERRAMVMLDLLPTFCPNVERPNTIFDVNQRVNIAQPLSRLSIMVAELCDDAKNNTDFGLKDVYFKVLDNSLATYSIVGLLANKRNVVNNDPDHILHLLVGEFEDIPVGDADAVNLGLARALHHLVMAVQESYFVVM
jgi:hypothetical protein